MKKQKKSLENPPEKELLPVQPAVTDPPPTEVGGRHRDGVPNPVLEPAAAPAVGEHAVAWDGKVFYY